ELHEELVRCIPGCLPDEIGLEGHQPGARIRETREADEESGDSRADEERGEERGSKDPEWRSARVGATRQRPRSQVTPTRCWPRMWFVRKAEPVQDGGEGPNRLRSYPSMVSHGKIVPHVDRLVSCGGWAGAAVGAGCRCRP